jgi:hypothetical protein
MHIFKEMMLPFKHSHTKGHYEGQSFHHILSFIAEVVHNLDHMILQGHEGYHVGRDGHGGCREKWPWIWVFFETQEPTSKTTISREKDQNAEGHCVPYYFWMS